MNAVPSLAPVSVEDIPDYPLPRGERLESHSFYLFHYHRYTHSRFYKLADWEVQGVALALWSIAQYEDPVGTLPEDPREIAAALPRMTMEAWTSLMQRDPNPLYGWTRCRVGREIRLMHKTVTEVAQGAIRERDRNAAGRTAEAEAKRISRLAAQVAAFGHARLAADDAFVCRLDELLLEMQPTGNRTKPVIRRALDRLGVRDLGPA